MAALSDAPNRTRRTSVLAVLTNAELSRLSHLATRLEKPLQSLAGLSRWLVARPASSRLVVRRTGAVRARRCAPARSRRRPSLSVASSPRHDSRDAGFSAATNNITLTPASTDKIDNGTAGASVTINTNGSHKTVLAYAAMPGWISI
jgi:hypothetical protein